MRIGISLPVRELGNDIAAIRDFAQAAEDLGLTHLRVPEQIIRAGSGPLHEPMTIMALIAGVTKTIELVPSVIILPARQTVLVAKQAATLDVLSGGRLRLGVGIGNDESEYAALGADFHNRGARCEEQMRLLHQLWTQETVEFDGTWDRISGVGVNPLPIQRPIPMWIGCAASPVPRVRRRIGQLADGWFNLCSPEEFPAIRDDIYREAEAAGRDSASLGTEAGVAVVGPREHEWQSRVAGWRTMGLSHLCLRTLGGGLEGDQHIERMRRAVAELPDV
ncbi:MAG: TIGR03619 family F420-dependent LLM class oxidoreductase [Rhodospirillaceae bacterium]|jgi:probable F420-dependent oxidoreductase|nr:TIGR03619 family F420-dependent LLM class oxidoreductase [Rhodospirillaceae bacterium]MBT4487421.1 TIGR03619 family F420-dependent LLM class oxidoreductase [Rhodospirillaceae bacterium]MBT5193565.1 TIGR03619 family F420-dependent LLM class oxidoreductase [Rhodospirillaceae bacterium]MBT5895472.1 TIGR03619 family F420-dependent LLM class oxidoreductase [Rhodospirillaceae bacterium]MBT6429403.1 TIGR03619 family F420-dependent LLM class oxidoreductase [Rhodospirillaceae bacterium]